MSPLNHKSAILIIGGGTWGCSAALQLARRGHRRIKVLDSSRFPSPSAAGNDINKIAEEANLPFENDSDKDYAWNRIHQLAMDAWKHDPLYAPFYHPTGFIMSACGSEAYNQVLKYVSGRESQFMTLRNAADFRATMPKGILTGDFPQWRGFWQKDGAGWVFARGALEAIHAEAERLGVEFVAGSLQGKVEALLYSDDGFTILGARTTDGAQHIADQTILAAASTNRVDRWYTKTYQFSSMPSAASSSNQTDASNHEMKICDEHPGYCNFVRVNGELRSVPFVRQQIPLEAEQRMRRLLHESMPTLESHEFSFARVCWDADTVDRLFLIDRHPKYAGLVLAVGGSGHGFMTMPAAGIIVADVLEGILETRLRTMLRWRPETAVDRNWQDTQDRFGADGKVMDFRDVRKWTQIRGDDAKL
ncbi:fructosyl amine:oxygen oxidoreductase [Glonium stellatum]|uniref:Fructosyl amine:oxygen oxidoreductase n=1 Tax=Glonium stellatum TaxID=574774 RepID=A0A8E2FEL8_9PEZI|nr:fructosyl amine:oxygen oxidoreductase [Glonium stellatum]